MPKLRDGDDHGLARRLAAGDTEAFEALMRRYNGRLFRVARAILKDDGEAEDVLQDAYLDAYRHIHQFKGGAQLSTWLTRIVVNRALMRVRAQRRERTVLSFERQHVLDGPPPDLVDVRAESPQASALRAELRQLLERTIDGLPLAFRTVFVMREVEDMSAAEIAESLDIPLATVRTRLFRARGLLRAALEREAGQASADVFHFAGERCDRIVARVLARLAESSRT